MTTWNELKKEINIAPAEMDAIESLAYLHAERIKRGISQQEFAKCIGMKQPQLAKIENLSSIPSLATLIRYASGLDLSLTLTFKPLVHN